jgi:hypothetical protein
LETPVYYTTLQRLKIILLIACVLSALLAGENMYRYLLEVPGWRHIDIMSWGEYTRHADLANGALIFPVQAIGSFLLLGSASFIAIKNKSQIEGGVLWIHLATAFAGAGLVLTFFAAPYLLNVAKVGNNRELLQYTFDQFHFWGQFRALAQVLSFFTCIVAIGKILR